MTDLLRTLKKRTSLLRTNTNTSASTSTAHTQPDTSSVVDESPSPSPSPGPTKSPRPRPESRLTFSLKRRQSSRESLSQPPSDSPPARSSPPPPIDFAPPSTPRRGPSPAPSHTSLLRSPSAPACASTSATGSSSKSRSSFLRSFRIPSTPLALTFGASPSATAALTRPADAQIHPGIRGKISSPLPLGTPGLPDTARRIIPYPELILVTPSGRYARPAWSPDSLMSVIDIPAEPVARHLDLGESFGEPLKADGTRRVSHTGTFGHLLDISAVEAQLEAEKEEERDNDTDVDSPQSIFSVWAKDGSADEVMLKRRQDVSLESVTGETPISTAGAMQTTPTRPDGMRRTSRKQVPQLSDLSDHDDTTTIYSVEGHSPARFLVQDLQAGGLSPQDETLRSSPLSLALARDARSLSRATSRSANRWYMREEEEALELLEGLEAVRSARTPDSAVTVRPGSVGTGSTGRSLRDGEDPEFDEMVGAEGMHSDGFGSSYSIAEPGGHDSTRRQIPAPQEDTESLSAVDGDTEGIERDTAWLHGGFGSSYSISDLVETVSREIEATLPALPPRSPLRRSLPNLRSVSAFSVASSVGTDLSANGSEPLPQPHVDARRDEPALSPKHAVSLSGRDPITPTNTQHRRASSGPPASPSSVQWGHSFLDLTLTSPLVPQSPRDLEADDPLADDGNSLPPGEADLHRVRKASYAALGKRQGDLPEAILVYNLTHTTYAPPGSSTPEDHEEAEPLLSISARAEPNGDSEANEQSVSSYSQRRPLASLDCARIVSTASGISITVTEASVSPPGTPSVSAGGYSRLPSEARSGFTDDGEAETDSLDSLEDVALATLGEDFAGSPNVATPEAAEQQDNPGMTVAIEKSECTREAGSASKHGEIEEAGSGLQDEEASDCCCGATPPSPSQNSPRLRLQGQRSITAPSLPATTATAGRVLEDQRLDTYQVKSPYVDLGGSITGLGFPKDASPFPHPRRGGASTRLVDLPVPSFEVSINKQPVHATFVRLVQPASHTLLQSPVTLQQMTDNYVLLSGHMNEMRLAWDGTQVGMKKGIRRVMELWREADELLITSAISDPTQTDSIDVGFRLTLAELENVYMLAFNPLDIASELLPWLRLPVASHNRVISALQPVFMGLMSRPVTADVLSDFVQGHLDARGQETWAEASERMCVLTGLWLRD